MNIVLIGMKKCGKSTLAKRLAKRTGATFFDSDQQIEALYKSETGESLTFREIFRRVGEGAFAQYEDRAMWKLAQTLEHRNTPAVIALGGRTAMQEQLHGLIKSLGVVFYLRVTEQELLDRILSDELPAFLDPENPEDSFRRIFDQRAPHYEMIADEVIDLSGKTESESLDCLLDRAKARGFEAINE